MARIDFMIGFTNSYMMEMQATALHLTLAGAVCVYIAYVVLKPVPYTFILQLKKFPPYSKIVMVLR